MKIRVFIAEDHALVRHGVRTILESEGDIEVVGESENGPDALARIREHKPDVALLDVNLPGLSGLEIASQIRAEGLPVNVIVVTGYDSISYLSAALSGGVSGFVLKEQSPRLIPIAVRACMQGGSLYPLNLLCQIAAGWNSPDRRGVLSPLSPREIEILRYIAQGCSNRKMGQSMNLAESTIKKYVYNLMSKLGAADRGHAAILAMRMGLLER